MSYLDEFKVSFSEKQNVIGSLGYYTTRREKIGVAHEDINTEYIFGLYDALMQKYPGKVQKKEVYSDDGTFANYEYVISTGEYPTSGLYTEPAPYSADTHIKKPKYLVLNAIHGIERKTTISTYRFIRDVLNGHNVSPLFREGVAIHVVPVGNPSGFDAYTRTNADGVDLNRDFHKVEKGTAAKETQAIANWLEANKDADLFIDFHNSSATNEIVAIIGCPDNDTIDATKKIALRGVDRVIPFWKTVIKDTKVLTPVGEDENGNLVLEEKDVIFAYSSSLEYPNALAFNYATNVVGIPSIAIETTIYSGDYFKEIDTKPIYQPNAIALGAEALGNILLEFQGQAFYHEVGESMKNVDSKLGTLLETIPCNFRKVTGSFTPSEDTWICEITGLPSNFKEIEVIAETDIGEGVQNEDNTYRLPLNYVYYSNGAYRGGREDTKKSRLPITTAQYSMDGELSAVWDRGTLYNKDAGTITFDMTKQVRYMSSQPKVGADGFVDDTAQGQAFVFAAKNVDGSQAVYMWTAYCWDD